MKVAIIVNEIDIRGGTHKQILRLAQYLKCLHCEVFIITKFYNLEKTYPEFGEMNIRFICLENWCSREIGSTLFSKIKNKFHKMKDAVKLVSMIPKDVDILNFHDNNLYATILLSRIVLPSKVRFVWQINDLAYCFHVGVFDKVKDSWKDKIKRIYIHFVTKCIDEITVNVSKNAELVEKCLGRKAHVFYCGVDLNSNLDKHVFNENRNVIRILSTGIFYEYRNYEKLVEVVEQLILRETKVHLDIIGATETAPDYAKKIKTMIEEKNLGDEITIWGQVDEAKYVELHNQADMFAFININQSWGLAVFEAMSCGLPVIVSESVGAIELLNHNEDAIIVDPENIEEISDVVLKLMNDKEYYNKISENAFNAVKEFTWDKLYSEKMLELFKELTDK